MSNEYLFGFGALLVIALLVIQYLRGHKKNVKNRTPDSVMNEVEVLLAYGKRKDAVELLKMGVEQFPGNKPIGEKLADLEK